MGKILAWLLVNGATVLGLLQAIVKAMKELLTGVINLLSLFIPSVAAQQIVKMVRDALNKVDEVIEMMKGYFLPKV